MTLTQFRRWLQAKIDWLQAFPTVQRLEGDHIDSQGLVEEARCYA
ncbi:hypothetical protein [Botrimarina mediterranea]|uniref:Uncharacterized protein n=1 Tax=Botrimarina mediterranea TaxID=2528022 RepID=A0A518K5J0_9BACT|nr:hypothetical protein [Botrimarina mediterranea]QDV73061.1 hypothetical protein Spa11_12500 [Botrimarina mediterranea]